MFPAAVSIDGLDSEVNLRQFISQVAGQAMQMRLNARGVWSLGKTA
jgi:hypothetical protein